MVEHKKTGFGHLYSTDTEKKFVEEYGMKKGEQVFGAVVGEKYREAHGRNWNQKRK